MSEVMSGNIDDKLRAEIINLVHYVQRLREEIAGITGRRNGQTTFESMSDQLDAIVGSTAEATNTILEGIEVIADTVEELRKKPDSEKAEALYDRIIEKTTQTMEVCSFQDITGQRVSKIIRSVRFIEERASALADLWGRDEIEELSGHWQTHDIKIEDGVQVEGPQLPGQAISQDDIDKLFD